MDNRRTKQQKEEKRKRQKEESDRQKKITIPYMRWVSEVESILRRYRIASAVRPHKFKFESIQRTTDQSRTLQ